MLYVGRLTSSTFNGFINGKLIDSLIIGIFGVYLPDHYEDALCVVD